MQLVSLNYFVIVVAEHIFLHMFLLIRFSACTRIAKKKAVTDTRIILFAWRQHYLSYFSS